MSAANATTNAGGKSANPIDAKREEFRKYLEKEGILESLTRSLVSLYEEPEKPTDALGYIKNNFAGHKQVVTELNAVKAENALLKEKVETLEKEKFLLQEQLDEAKKVAEKASASTASNDAEPTKKDATEKADAEKMDDAAASPSKATEDAKPTAPAEEVQAMDTGDDTPMPPPAEASPVKEEKSEEKQPEDKPAATPTSPKAAETTASDAPATSPKAAADAGETPNAAAEPSAGDQPSEEPKKE